MSSIYFYAFLLAFLSYLSYTYSFGIRRGYVLGSSSGNVHVQLDTSVQQTVSFRCRFNKRFVFGGASTSGSFSEAPQQTGKVKMTTFQETTSKFSCFR